MLAAGENLGRYKIQSAIGAGGMGEVFLAEDTELERPVAIKILPVEVAKDADRVRRFRQEAKSISALNHPNILVIYEIGEYKNSHFIVSEFVEGETLREWMRGKVSALSEILDIALQITAALNAAHASGIVHRDIKPENVMLREDGLVKVLDFGLAKLIEKPAANPDLEARTIVQSDTNAGMILGTPTYMSPEQARGKPIDKRTDLWSCGVVLYELLTGKPPFKGETISDIIASILTKEPDSFDDSKTYVPAGLEEIIFTLLQKEPDNRYQSAKDLQLDLRKLKRAVETETATEILPVANESENKTTNLQAVKTNPQDDETGEPSAGKKAARRKFVYFGLGFCLLALTAFLIWFNLSKNPPNDYADNSPTKTAPAVKLYWLMTEAEQLTFIRERARHIQTLIGDEPMELNDEALRAIKVEIDDYVEEKDSLSQKPFDEGLRVIYGRASQYAPLVIRAYETRQVPPALGLYQAMIESEYHDCLIHPSGPVGLFQFSRRTAASYDLMPKDYCNLEKQSDAAARHMSDLISDFGEGKSSWTLALFSFNQGGNKVRDYLRQLRGRGITERSFWTVFRYQQNLQPPLSDEGKEYVPRFFAAAIIGESPEAFDLPYQPLSTLKETKR